MSFRLACFMLECFILASHCIHSVSCSHLPRSVIRALAKFLCPDMPKLSMKSRAPAWPAPKRGKVRANMKKPAGQMKKLSAKPPCVPYTRVKGVQTKFRKERCRYGVSIQSLTSMPAARLLQKLTEDGILPKWTGAKCPHCATGRLGPFTQRLSKTNPAARLPSNFVWWTWCFHYSIRTPSSSAPLCLSWCTRDISASHLGHGRQSCLSNLRESEAARGRHVELKEKDIIFGKAGKWPDVEADEVDLGKDLSEDGSSLTWEQWGGLVERGRANT